MNINILFDKINTYNELARKVDNSEMRLHVECLHNFCTPHAIVTNPCEYFEFVNACSPNYNIAKQIFDAPIVESDIDGVYHVKNGYYNITIYLTF